MPFFRFGYFIFFFVENSHLYGLVAISVHGLDLSNHVRSKINYGHGEGCAFIIVNLGHTGFDSNIAPDSLIQGNWTARLFVFGRRLLGLRLKVIVLLAAEIVGICYYHLLAIHLPPSKLRSQLLEIVEDERSHLFFHCDFLRSQTRKRWQKRIFIVVWRLVMAAAAVVVAIDHRRAIVDLGIGVRTVLTRWKSYSELAEALVVSDSQNNRGKNACGEDATLHRYPI